MKGKLYLIPSNIGDCELTSIIPENIRNIINSVDYYIVENIRTARRYLIKLGIKTSINDLIFFELNKHTDLNKIPDYLSPLNNNKNVGLISEAGVPCVADPGAVIVSLAHEYNIQVVPLVGPSSILLALMASGLNGQNFAFNGYLPVKRDERIKTIRNIEKKSKIDNQTQIFFDTPFRNIQLFNDVINTCNDNTFVCIACDITLNTEYIRTKPVYFWKKNVPDINKKPTIFLIHKY
jgi:16S rRNA (cytidine1402-2'-O)-methyltransferase